MFWTSNLYFFIKENWICAMTRHHAKANIKILLTRNLPFDSDVRQWSHPFIIPLHCLWTKSNNRRRGQFECNVTWFYFCFDFVRSHTRCGCCSIVCLRFQLVQLKSDSHLPKKLLFISFNESSLKMMKNAFYFILKPLFVLKIFKFLSWHFVHVEETA